MLGPPELEPETRDYEFGYKILAYCFYKLFIDLSVANLH